MSVQNRTDFTNYPLFTDGDTLIKDNEVIKQDGARATVLKRGTIMAQIAATRKWVPLTVVTALDGSNTARGILTADIAAASLVAGDVNAPMIVFGYHGCTADGSQIVLENSLTINNVCSDTPAGADNGAVNVRRIEDDLARIGICVKGTIDVMNLEN